MTETQRVKKVINWLVFMEYAENERELAEKLGYTKSSFSQIVNGKVPLSERFVQKLASVDRNINEVWIMTGEGNECRNYSGKCLGGDTNAGRKPEKQGQADR